MKVIVGFDISSGSNSCVERIASLKWPSGTEFKFVNVVKSDPLGLIDQDFLVQARHRVIETTARLNLVLKDCVIDSIFDSGNPAAKILSSAQDWHADLVIVGANTKSLLEKALLGSVSQAVLEHAPCPVLIAREGHQQNEGFKNVLVALDATSPWQSIISCLTDQPFERGTKVRFISVIPELPKEYSDAGTKVLEAIELLRTHAAIEEDTTDMLFDMLKVYRDDISRFDWSVEIATGDPGRALTSVATSQNADLIIVGFSGKFGLEKLVLGSVSRYVASHSPTSVLVVRPKEQEKDHQESHPSDSAEFSGSRSEDWTPHLGLLIH